MHIRAESFDGRISTGTRRFSSLSLYDEPWEYYRPGTPRSKQDSLGDNPFRPSPTRRRVPVRPSSVAPHELPNRWRPLPFGDEGPSDSSPLQYLPACPDPPPIDTAESARAAFALLALRQRTNLDASLIGQRPQTPTDYAYASSRSRSRSDVYGSFGQKRLEHFENSRLGNSDREIRQRYGQKSEYLLWHQCVESASKGPPS